VTGGGRGLGAAAAWALAEAGADIALLARTEDQIVGTAREIEDATGRKVLACACDVSDEASVDEAASLTVATFGRVDVLVNNAGLYDEHPFTTIDLAAWQAAWRRTLALNLFAAADLCFCIGRHMVECGGGRIINVSSRGAFRGEPTAPAYGASKAGLNSLSQSLAQALAPHGVYVYVVAPGFVETEMVTEMLAGRAGDEIRRQSPLGRVAKPDEVAHTIAFLALGTTQFLTGAIVDINGASYLRS
jgi:NAD(P)-dependent dehydrogenase (short-subunit alcohol dehydrogenase family)